MQNSEAAEKKELERQDALKLRYYTLVDHAKGFHPSPVAPNQDVQTEYSNTITRIELVPRFCRGRGWQIPVAEHNASNSNAKSLIIQNGYTLKIKEEDGSWIDEDYICTIKPAIIRKREKGIEQDYYCYPSDREELIEKQLFLLAINNGISKSNDGGLDRYGVHFSLYEIYNQLESINRTMSYADIKESLMIIRDSTVLITRKGVQNKAEVFPTISLEVEGKGKGRDKCFVGFSDFVMAEIFAFNYRQYVYSRYARIRNALARYLDMHLSTRFVWAGVDNHYRLYISEIFEGFGKKQISLEQKRRDMRTALSVLVSSGTVRAVPNAKKTLSVAGEEDYYYEVEPTETFVNECILGNQKRNKSLSIKDKIEGGQIKSLPQQIGLAI